MEVTLRPARPDDLAAICALAEDLAATHHAAWPAIFAPASGTMRDAGHWRVSLEGDRHAAFMAEDAQGACGFITCSLIVVQHSLMQPRRLGYVNSVCVAARSRGRGLGRDLMAAAEAWAVQRGATEMELTVWAFNQPALQLYEELGYSVRSHLMGRSLPTDTTPVTSSPDGTEGSPA